MYTTTTEIRIHYALTDQMGVVYHGHYAQFYEIGRGEAIRELGYTYKDIEAMGIIMPVVDIHSRFLRPALGGQVQIYNLPANLSPIYGVHPVGMQVWLRVRFSPVVR